MAAETPTKPPTTLGLTGLTSNAMALIAPGAFLWLTFFIQSAYGAPLAAQGMWFGIFAAVILCLATAIAYAELSKLYPGAGSSYFFAEQAFLSRSQYKSFARIAKFTVGWASHLYYWGYPGLMVGVTASIRAPFSRRIGVPNLTISIIIGSCRLSLRHPSLYERPVPKHLGQIRDAGALCRADVEATGRDTGEQAQVGWETQQFPQAKT